MHRLSAKQTLALLAVVESLLQATSQSGDFSMLTARSVDHLKQHGFAVSSDADGWYVGPVQEPIGRHYNDSVAAADMTPFEVKDANADIGVSITK